MPKTNLKISITSNEEETTYETPAIISDGQYKYREPNNTLVIFDMHNKKLLRENENLKMTYLFEKNNKTNGTLFIKELNKEIFLTINTSNIEIKDKNIYIEFEIEENTFKYRIEEIR